MKLESLKNGKFKTISSKQQRNVKGGLGQTGAGIQRTGNTGGTPVHPTYEYHSWESDYEGVRVGNDGRLEEYTTYTGSRYYWV